MKILFIDHSFHEKTRSSHFFVSLLASHFTVEVMYVDRPTAMRWSIWPAVTSFDLVVLWQMDFLAPLVLARGVPTVVVPMFDGSSNMPDLHWLWARKARIVNFSRRLHDRVTHLGGSQPPGEVFPAARARKGACPFRWSGCAALAATSRAQVSIWGWSRRYSDPNSGRCTFTTLPTTRSSIRRPICSGRSPDMSCRCRDGSRIGADSTISSAGTTRWLPHGGPKASAWLCSRASRAACWLLLMMRRPMMSTFPIG